MLHNLHAGETCVVIANGPGLRSVPDELLQKYTTFGSNHIYLRTVPTYYVNVDAYNLANKEKRAVFAPVIESARMAFLWEEYARHFPNAIPLRRSTKQAVEFPTDPLSCIGSFANVTFVALELAYWMGFTTALIVGLDFDYWEGGRHFYGDLEGFPDKPCVDKAAWHKKHTEYFAAAGEAWKQAGRRIVNLSEPTACTVLERGSWRDW
jgi:hypothetical protein